MSRRRAQHVPFALDARGIDSLPFDEIKAIMRAAEDLITRGGRTSLCKILEGSRDKDVLTRRQNDNPSWGFYRSLTNEEVLARIDWTILHRYLEIEYFDRLPLLCYTPAGLAIEIDTITDELLARMRLVTGSGNGCPIPRLAQRNAARDPLAALGKDRSDARSLIPSPAQDVDGARF